MNGWKVAFVALLAVGCAAAPREAKTAPQPGAPQDDRLYVLLRTDRKAFAEEVSRSSTSEPDRAKAIVLWLTQHFAWKETDYEKRTVQEIIDRRGGNCADLAAVALAAMNDLHLQLRRVHDVHVRTPSAERGERAHALVKDKGDQYSVFGRHHNDHVWLEVYDSAAREWFPADPWSGLVGLDEWMKARVGFGEHKSLAPDAADMIVPIGIFAEDEAHHYTVDRTRHYLVDELDRMYGGKLHTLPSWNQWVSLLDQLHDKVQGAFAGTTDLHDYEWQIDSLAATYEQLRSEERSAEGQEGKHLAATSPLYQYDTVALAEGVYAFVPVVGRAEVVTGNTLVVIGDDGVLVLDTGHFPSLARKMIADIRALTPKPVRYVVTSHWHTDHLFGNGAFRDAYPDVVFVGHAETRRLVLAKDPVYLDAQRQGPALVERYKNMLKTGLRKPGVPLDEATRAALTLALPELEAVADDDDVTLIPPALTFEGDSLRTYLGHREVRVLHLGRGDTAGDTMVYVPDAGVLATGDVVVLPTPYAYGSYVGEWRKVLQKVKDLHPKVLLPGHGPVQHDFAYVDALSALFASLQQQVGACVKKGLSLEETRKKVDFASFRDAFAGKDATQRAVFDQGFVEPGVGRAYEEAKGKISDE